MSAFKTKSETRQSREEHGVYFQLLDYEIHSSHPDSTLWLMEEILFCDMLLSFDLIRLSSVAACLSNPAGQPRYSLYSLLPKDSSRTGSNSLVVSHGIAYSLSLSLSLSLSYSVVVKYSSRTRKHKHSRPKTHTHTHTHTHRYTNRGTHTHTLSHTHTNTHTHTHSHTQTHTRIRTNTHTQTHTHKHSHTQAHTHTNTHTHTHTREHTHSHTHTYTHYMCAWLSLEPNRICKFTIFKSVCRLPVCDAAQIGRQLQMFPKNQLFPSSG